MLAPHRRSFARAPLGLAALFFSVACDEGDPLERALPMLKLEGSRIDFGVVLEGTSATQDLSLSNVGQVPLSLGLSIAEGGSPDFSVPVTTATVAGSNFRRIAITFTPSGAGEDHAVLVLTSDDPGHARTEIELAGGPIAPRLEVSPDPIDFGPATTPTVVRPAAIKNTGSANLHVSRVAIDPDANTAFSLRASFGEMTLEPNSEVEVVIDHARSGIATAGQLLVDSDDPDSPQFVVRLLPDPFRACEDGDDNDGDGLQDFPDDPGCTSATDNDEANPPECDNGTTMPCGTDVGECDFGERTCANRVWGVCIGGQPPVAEGCDNLDNDCDGRFDEEVSETCTINTCAGARACIENSGVGGGQWTNCLPITTSAETCDGMDNNCNGTTDEGIVEACTDMGCDGTRICVPGGTGTFTACQVTGVAEICDTLDNNCDGTPDNLPDISCGMGLCARTVAACVSGADNTCTPGTPVNEVCNNMDDNCDGMPDNLPQLSCGMGPCARVAPACVGGAPGTCTPGTPGTEVCNGIDDNCNGTPDDGGVCGGGCGLMSTAADPQEPNNATGAANPVVAYGGIGTHVYSYDVTLTPGDNDWIQYTFAPAGSASFATMTAEVLCTSWAGAGCGATAATVGLEAWYFDLLQSARDDQHNGQSGLANVTSLGAVSQLGGLNQRFRLRIYPSATVCAGEAMNAEVRVTVTWDP